MFDSSDLPMHTELYNSIFQLKTLPVTTLLVIFENITQTNS